MIAFSLSKTALCECAETVEVASLHVCKEKTALDFVLGEEQMKAVLVPAFIIQNIESSVNNDESIEGVAYFYMNGFIGEISQRLTVTRHFSPKVHRDKWTKIGAENAGRIFDETPASDQVKLLKRLGFVRIKTIGRCRMSGSALIFTPKDSGENWTLFPTKDSYTSIQNSLVSTDYSAVELTLSAWLSPAQAYIFPFTTEQCSRVLIQMNPVDVKASGVGPNENGVR